MLTKEADFLVLLIFLIRVVSSLHLGSFLQFLVFSKFLNICKAPLNHRETALDKCTIIIIIIILLFIKLSHLFCCMKPHTCSVLR